MEDPAEITTEQISEALGGVEISDQDNVSKVLSAVVEGSCEVGTTYYSTTLSQSGRTKGKLYKSPDRRDG